MGSSKKQLEMWQRAKLQKKKHKQKKTLQKLEKRLKQSDVKKDIKADPEIKSTSTKVERPTLSIAVAGSILDNAQTPEFRTYLAGQIARAACIFQVDEIVVFNDMGEDKETDNAPSRKKSCEMMATILQFLECPQYLRKHLFPHNNHLKYAGLLNPLNAPHHFAKGEDFPFREGVVLTNPAKEGRGSYVDVGLAKPVNVDRTIDAFYRVTVRLKREKAATGKGPAKYTGVVVSPRVPQRETGKYWGYQVRIANSLSEIFTKSSFSADYDLTIGTSDKGTPVDEFSLSGDGEGSQEGASKNKAGEDGEEESDQVLQAEQKKQQPPSFKHCLIVFGGVQGLEFALQNDEQLKVDDVSLLFDHYLNTCPDQGCRTIRTEEAILISLTELRKKLQIV